MDDTGTGERPRVIVVGGGVVGSYLATLLSDDSYRVTVIERSEREVLGSRQDDTNVTVVRANGTQPSVLEDAGVRQATAVVAITDSDEANLVVSMLAKFEYGVGRVVARVNDPRNAPLFDVGMGVDVGVNQADLIAHFVQQDLGIDDVYTLMKIGQGDSSVVQLKVAPHSVVDHAYLRNVSLPDGALLVAVIRDGKVSVPNGDSLLRAGDEVIAFASDDQLPQVRRAFA